MNTFTQHLLVSGRVQGVGYRQFTVRQAEALGITGWVKNREDGRVEAVVQGPEGQLVKLIDRLKRGPAAARVSGIEAVNVSGGETFTGFEVRH